MYTCFDLIMLFLLLMMKSKEWYTFFFLIYFPVVFFIMRLKEKTLQILCQESNTTYIMYTFNVVYYKFWEGNILYFAYNMDFFRVRYLIFKLLIYISIFPFCFIYVFIFVLFYLFFFPFEREGILKV